LTLNDYIRASGNFVMNVPPVNNDIIIGHFNSADAPASNNRNLLGLSVAGPQVPPRLGAFLFNSSASGTENQAINTETDTEVFSALTHYSWTYNYDPTGGPTGDGQLVVWFTNASTFGVLSRTVNVTPAQRATGASFDSFGIIQRGLSTSTNLTTLFIDDVTYTVGGPVIIQKIERLSSGTLKITFSSYATNHKIQQSPNLQPGSWSEVPAVTYEGSVDQIWSATFDMPVQSPMFYRVMANPVP
jgi:hypothetical protein